MQAAEERGEYEHPRVSPDGGSIAVDFGAGGNRQIWMLDTERGIRTPLTTDGNNFMPLWTPDGSRVVFSSLSTGRWELLSKPADGSGEAEMFLEIPLCADTELVLPGRRAGVLRGPPRDRA